LQFKKRRAVSPVIAELLLIVITVAIGTLVYSFASTAFGGFGAGFSNLVSNAGGQLTENLVVEQVYFLHNSTGSAGGCPASMPAQTGECAGDIFIGNSGSNTIIVNQIFVTNVTASSAVSLPGNFAFFGYSNTLHTWTVALPNTTPPSTDTVLTGCTAKCFLSIAPGQTVMLRFLTMDPAKAGTTYAFTFITSRGNQIVAYEKA
jgi:flagellin-like protein